MCDERGDMHGERGGVHGIHPPLRDTAGQCAGGTHPTGMHPCSRIIRRIQQQQMYKKIDQGLNPDHLLSCLPL